MTLSKTATEDFVRLLRQSLLADNQQRQESEARLQSIERETKIGLLLSVLVGEKDPELLELSALMLRQQIEQNRNISQFSLNCLAAIKNTLPQLALQQQVPGVRDKLVDVLSSTFNLNYNEILCSWPELATFFYDCFVRSNHEVGRSIGLRLLKSAPSVINPLTDENLRDIFKILNESMLILTGNTTNISISFVPSNSSIDNKNTRKTAIDSIKAFTSLAIELKNKKIQPHFSSTLSVIFHLLNTINDPDFSVEIINELNALIECKPSIVKNHVGDILQQGLTILASAQASANLRVPCMEMVVGIAESLKKTFKVVAKEHLPSIVDIFLRHMTLINEDQAWAFSVSDDEEENELATEAETSLDRLTCAVGGKLMFPIIMEQVSPLFASKVWQHRCAALTTISCIAEGCKKVLKPFLPSVVDAIVPFMQDEHPRVIYTCINAIGQLAVDYESYFQINYHSKIFPLVIFAAENYHSLPKLHAHAICCFVNLIDNCPIEVLKIYADTMFKNLHDSLINAVNNLDKPGVTLVMENCLSSLGKLATTIGTEFAKYYSNIVPELITMVRTFSNTPHVQYYIDTLDALADILMAVGSDLCKQDLDQILDLLKSFEIQVIKNGDRNFQIEYLEIMADIAKLFKESFSPILPKLMPTLLEIANTSLEKHIIKSAVNEPEDSYSQSFSAHTDALNDKYSVLKIIHRLVKILKGHMAIYFDQICDCSIKNFNNNQDTDIHNICSDIFVSLLKSASQNASGYTLNLWDKIFTTIYSRTLNHDSLFESQYSFDTIRRCIKIVSYNGINNNIMVRINELMDSEIVNIIKNIGSISVPEVKEDCEELDDEIMDNEDEHDSEDNSLSSIHDLQRSLFKLLNKNYVPFWNQIFQRVIQLSECQNFTCRSWALCMFCNIFEYIPEDSVQISGTILERIKSCCMDKNPSVLQAAIFNVGIIAEFAGQYYQPFLSDALAKLVQIVTSVSKDDDSMGIVISNAICSCAKIMKFCPLLISSFDDAVKTWVSWLPTHDDEVDFILEYLLELIETKYQVVAGPSNSTLGNTLNSIASMLPLANDHVTKKTVGILLQIKTHVPDAFNNWFKNLSPSFKENVLAAHSIAGITEKIN